MMKLKPLFICNAILMPQKLVQLLFINEQQH